MSGEIETIATVQAIPTPTPMGLLQMAVQGGADMDTIERLVALQDRMQAQQAEREFNAAINRAQSAMGPVGADLSNPQTKSKYASYQALDKRVRPLYTREGLALSFDTSDSPIPDHIRILCYVSHPTGHTRTYHIDMPNDGKGAKGGDVMTKTHATGAAVSYGKRYLVIMIFNIAVGEDDHDGNDVDPGEIDRNVQYIQSARDARELLKVYTEVYTPAYNAQNKTACRAYNTAKEARQKELK